MHLTTVLYYGLAALTLTNAAPLVGDSSRREVADGDDRIAYTWAIPERSRKREDGDDKVAYTWAVPQTRKREDGDDKVVYTWAVPE
ncbi:hypothetical protein ASPACDRAFT_76432 [Aspergillus aculeatus ATCC 16872]|uniref:Uncharacterized protein n=1 Tax=Aspergillus aculeatus (strain ATCC 16872 / CBS 172.66 / WB 5094) TaxID=690307 RepID=A0A1L9X1C2_ASPA1|nr:uncharacterized protein ASPACDRAFT_76432 [Aspergillus aculeatus ATCC 16872]OJK01928.1 hypothetical protein ASPACDRAFT_76432 [Aspergillus aculeatus ATCC 16872]